MDDESFVRIGDANEGSRKKKKTAHENWLNLKETLF